MASWAAVSNSCFDGRMTLGRNNDISFLISHRVVKTGMYLKYTWNMTKVNEFCTICNAPEDIEHLCLHCTLATRVWTHFLLLLNKALSFKATKTVDLLLLRIFHIKVDRNSYLLALYPIKLILYQLWIARCSHRLHQKLIQPSAIITRTEAAIKQRITICFQAHTIASVKQMQIWRAKDALYMLDTNNQLTFKFWPRHKSNKRRHVVCLHSVSSDVHTP